MGILNRLISKIPDRYWIPILRARHAYKIRKGTFVSAEPEFALLDTFAGPGDWVIDAGANYGLYTARLSTLVGATGRVFSFEPVPATFESLTANVSHLLCKNVTLINAALSDHSGEAAINVPVGRSGRTLDGWASLEEHNVSCAFGQPGKQNVYVMPLDSLVFARPIKLIKVDVEGHELPALKGMAHTLEQHSPALIVEEFTDAVTGFLATFGYTWEELEGSPNHIFRRR